MNYEILGSGLLVLAFLLTLLGINKWDKGGFPKMENPPAPPNKKPIIATPIPEPLKYSHPKAIQPEVLKTIDPRREWLKKEIDLLLHHYSDNGPILEHSLMILLKSFMMEYPSKPVLSNEQQWDWDQYMKAFSSFIEVTEAVERNIPHHPNLHEFRLFLKFTQDRLHVSYIPATV